MGLFYLFGCDNWFLFLNRLLVGKLRARIPSLNFRSHFRNLSFNICNLHNSALGHLSQAAQRGLKVSVLIWLRDIYVDGDLVNFILLVWFDLSDLRIYLVYDVSYILRRAVMLLKVLVVGEGCLFDFYFVYPRNNPISLR